MKTAATTALVVIAALFSAAIMVVTQCSADQQAKPVIQIGVTTIR